MRKGVGNLFEHRPCQSYSFEIRWPATARTPGLRFETKPFKEAVEIAGFPSVTINTSIAGGRVDSFAVLSDVDKTGYARVITQATMNPELRNGLGTVSPIVPGEIMRLRPPAQPHDFVVRPGHKLRLDLVSHQADKVATFAGPGVVTVVLGGASPTSFRVGVVESPGWQRDPIDYVLPD